MLLFLVESVSDGKVVNNIFIHLSESQQIQERDVTFPVRVLI
jgi:hypothetical protein